VKHLGKQIPLRLTGRIESLVHVPCACKCRPCAGTTQWPKHVILAAILSLREVRSSEPLYLWPGRPATV
jgi:hypothetical protein